METLYRPLIRFSAIVFLLSACYFCLVPEKQIHAQETLVFSPEHSDYLNERYLNKNFCGGWSIPAISVKKTAAELDLEHENGLRSCKIVFEFLTDKSELPQRSGNFAFALSDPDRSLSEQDRACIVSYIESRDSEVMTPGRAGAVSANKIENLSQNKEHWMFWSALYLVCLAGLAILFYRKRDALWNTFRAFPLIALAPVGLLLLSTALSFTIIHEDFHAYSYMDRIDNALSNTDRYIFFPYFLLMNHLTAVFSWITGIREFAALFWTNALLCALSSIVFYLVVEMISGERRIGVTAAFLFAAFPPLIRLSGSEYCFSSGVLLFLTGTGLGLLARERGKITYLLVGSVPVLVACWFRYDYMSLGLIWAALVLSGQKKGMLKIDRYSILATVLAAIIVIPLLANWFVIHPPLGQDTEVIKTGFSLNASILNPGYSPFIYLVGAVWYLFYGPGPKLALRLTALAVPLFSGWILADYYLNFNYAYRFQAHNQIVFIIGAAAGMCLIYDYLKTQMKWPFAALAAFFVLSALPVVPFLSQRGFDEEEFDFIVSTVDEITPGSLLILKKKPYNVVQAPYYPGMYRRRRIDTVDITDCPGGACFGGEAAEAAEAGREVYFFYGLYCKISNTSVMDFSIHPLCEEIRTGASWETVHERVIRPDVSGAYFSFMDEHVTLGLYRLKN